jgi:aspartyl-tRNA synthetase
MQYSDAMNRFGVDKPDLRFGFELKDFSETFRASTFKVFQATVASGGAVKAINAKGLADLTQGELKALEEIAKSLGAKGLAFIKVEGGEWKSPIVKFLSEAEKAALASTLGSRTATWSSSRRPPGRRPARSSGGSARGRRAPAEARQAHHKADDWKFLWVVDFPLMSYDEEKKSYVATHHPFTAPCRGRRPHRLGPQGRRGQHYDIVLNGMELGRRVDPDPPAGAPEEDLRGRAEDPGRRRGEPLRLHAARPSPTAPRRTAASPSAWTGSWRSSAARPASGT